MITDAIQHNLELTIRQTISAAITTSMTDMQNIITNQQILLSNQQRTIKGLTNKTKKLDEIIESQSVKINDQLSTIEQLKQSVASLDRRLEETGQYSRRTSLRFNSVKLPTKPNGQIIKPINSDQLVLDICNNELGLDLQLQDLGRTYAIGPVQDDKADIIARFISYRPRQQVCFQTSEN
jgi:predicted RNase H-like nuclease (RuvC/YqgF family)